VVLVVAAVAAAAVVVGKSVNKSGLVSMEKLQEGCVYTEPII